MALNVKTLAQQFDVSEDKFRKSLSEIPFQVGDALGCGNIGCTFAGDRGMVIKLTGNESEVSLWQQIIDLEQQGIDLSMGVPEVYGIGEIKSIGAYWVAREEVEPLVLGSEMSLSRRTKRYLFGRDVSANLSLLKEDWSFVSMLERAQENGMRPREKTWKRAEMLDEDLRKLYFLTDIEEEAERQPSVAEDVWMEAYIKSAMSVRGPLEGVGEVLSTILAESGETWVTDVHLGNVGWRLKNKPQLLVYDWLTIDFIPNGLGVA